MPISLARPTTGDIPELGRIAFEAFGALQDRHHVERDFPSVEVATMLVGLFASRPEFFGVAARRDGRLIGSNFIQFTDPVAAVGPITIDPSSQSHGVGRALMQAVIDEAKSRGVERVRLQQEAINTTSMSLYTKLGFDWRTAVALMVPAASEAADPRIRALERGDLAAIDRLSTKHYHTTRRGDAELAFDIGVPGVGLMKRGELTGYLFPGFLGHGFTESVEDMIALVGAATRAAPPQFHRVFVPLIENDFHRAMLARGARTIKLFNYMTMGPFHWPEGVWVPHVGC